VEEAVKMVSLIAPRRALLTHMSHSLDYQRLASDLPPGIEPAYDGMTVELGEDG
jgi:phosphoribosyl 1,2-cyclic phosphate phosphodiesterase